MDWKKFSKKLLFPHVLIIVILVIISAVMLVYIFINRLEMAPIAYIGYTLSFYSLTVFVIYLCRVLPRIYRRIKQKIYDNPLGNRYMTDAAFRTHVSLYISLGINLLYAGMNAVSGVVYRTKWFMIFALYYMILAVMRFLLLKYVRKNGIGKDRQEELKRARTCSIILLNLNFVLSGAVLMIMYQDKGFEYHGILIYAMAAYTFYTTIYAIVNLVRYRKYKSPANQRLMIALTGAGISMVVIGMSAYMIIKTSEELWTWREEQMQT